jgi:outer membrane protein OmpA-like peptidoglycan-associated protein/Tfp pilus assembly protein PilF
MRITTSSSNLCHPFNHIRYQKSDIRYQISILLLLLLSSVISAQPRGELSTKDPKAEKEFRKALGYYESRLNQKAVLSLEDALQRDPAFAEAWLLLGEISLEEGNREQAKSAFRRVTELLPEKYPAALLNLAGLEVESGSYDSAVIHYEQYLTYKISDQGRRKAEHGLASARFASRAVKNPVPFDPRNAGVGVNTSDDEFVNALSTDAEQLYFTVKLPTGRSYPDGRPELAEDFFVADLGKEGWTNRRKLGSFINTEGNEGAMTISADGRYLFFARCKARDQGGCDLYYFVRRGNDWEGPRFLKPPVSSPAWDSQPSFGSDGRTLYFASTRKGSKGSSDLWISRAGDDGTWSEPVNLGDSINTPGREMSPLIHPDGQTLYFASDGHTGMGGLDLFVARKKADGSWGRAVNLGYPINTPADELALIVDASGEWAYFSSDKLGGEGKYDIYRFPLYPEARPLAVTYMKGRVVDQADKHPLGARFELIDLETGTTVIESWSDAQSGEFLVCIPSEKQYGLNVSADGYLFHSEHFYLPGGHDQPDPYRKDIALDKLRTGESVVMRNVFFETDQYTLLPTSIAELDRLSRLLTVNPGISIEIGGHTDNVGSAGYNQTLSENRAAAVYQYLLLKDINPERLTYKGYGLTRPIAPNDTEDGRALNRRTEFTVTGLE